jgi:hypothetical protein
MMSLNTNCAPTVHLMAWPDPFGTRADGDSRGQAQPAAASKSESAACCATCGDDMRIMTAERAAVVCQFSRRMIYRWIEEASLHFMELRDGTVLVCGRTLAAKLEELEGGTRSLNR